MTPEDDLDLKDLARALEAATPRPDPAVRAAHLRLAQENFDRLQAAAGPARPSPERPRRGVWAGVKEMLGTLTSRGGLTVTTALVACGFLVLTPEGQGLMERPFTGGGPAVPEPLGADLVAEGEAVRPEALPEATGEAEATTAEPAPEAAVVAEAAPEAVATEAAPEVATVAEAAPGAAAPEPLAAEPAPEAAVIAEAAREIAPEIAGAALRSGAAAEASEAMAGLGGAADAAAGGAAPEEMASDAMAAMDFAAGIVAAAPADDMAAFAPPPDTEAFANEDPNPLRVTAEEPVSTFSIDVDTAAYAVVRQSLLAGSLPPPDAVRIEEMINYFPYDYPAPEAGEGPFRPSVSVMPTPWNPDTRLVSITLQGEMPPVEDRPPLNLVFLIDTSGSMEDASKLPLLKQSFRLMVDRLRPEDEVAIVAYAGAAGLVLPPTPASDRGAILGALRALEAGGSTNGQGGLEQAYATLAGMAAEGEVGRVILATDGDFNVGLSDPGALEDFVAAQRDSGAFLSVLGFGRGNLDDAAMQALAQNGNGRAAYIDSLAEAQKVLADQLVGELFPIAQDVKVQVEWNPAAVAEYRLIGYETRALRREDFNNDRVDAGELGAGHSVTAIYEVTPVGSPAQMTDPLRYQPQAVAGETSGEWGFLRLRWKEPGGTESELLETPITGRETAGPEARFAAAIAGWGQLLRGQDEWLGSWGYEEAIELALSGRGEDPFGTRAEAVQLMRLSQSLAP